MQLSTKDSVRTGGLTLAGLATLKLALHVLTNRQYGYFRDEFYYLACSDHLAAGYVDHPPLSILVLAAVRWLFGDSLFALRLLPAVAGAAVVLLTGLIVRELGGGRFAQGLAALAVLVAPVYLAVADFYSMNAFEPLLWTAAAYLVIRIFRTENPKLWLLFGVVAGLGLENKHSMLFFGFALAAALLLSAQRRALRHRWLWLGAAMAVLLFLPNLVWEVRHHWPTLEFMRNAQLYKNAPVAPAAFIGQQVLAMQPLTAPLWLAGLLFYLVLPGGRAYRVLGWTYVIIFVVFVVEQAKVYYLTPIYPMLFAAGAVTFATATSRPGWRWLRVVYVALLIAAGAITAPMGLPVLPPDTFIRYANRLGLSEPAKQAPSERHAQSELPQYFGDMFGWDELVAAVARAYAALPADERAACAIYTQNYGEAGAIDFLGSRYGLPRAISSHNNYWLWGPRDYTGKLVLVVGGSAAELSAYFESVTQVEVSRCRYCMPYENNLPIYLCRGIKRPLSELWLELKRYI